MELALVRCRLALCLVSAVACLQLAARGTHSTATAMVRIKVNMETSDTIHPCVHSFLPSPLGGEFSTCVSGQWRLAKKNTYHCDKQQTGGCQAAAPPALLGVSQAGEQVKTTQVVRGEKPRGEKPLISY
jgi:hypothetical protein